MTRPPLPRFPVEGGCLCGAARYRLSERPRAINACHCTDCKRLSGGGYAIFLQAEAATLQENDAPRDVYVKRADSGREIHVLRCARCGTRLRHASPAFPALAFIVAGTLDDPSFVVPASHIFMRSAAPDVAIAADAVTFDAAPPDRQLLWEAFARAYPG